MAGNLPVYIGGINTGGSTDKLQFLDYTSSAGKKHRKPSPAKRNEMTNQTIKAAQTLLKTRLHMLRKKDPATLASFIKWFGKYDAKSKHMILERIRNHLIMLKRLTHNNFYEITNLDYRRKAYSVVYPDDPDHKIALGLRFWQAPSSGMHSKAGKLIQAISHFNHAGSLKDYVLQDINCLALATSARDKALLNAENFARFIES